MSANLPWSAVVEKVNDRIKELTATCCNTEASDKDIRAAQAGMDELKRLLTLPETMKNTATQKSRASGTRGGY